MEYLPLVTVVILSTTLVIAFILYRKRIINPEAANMENAKLEKGFLALQQDANVTYVNNLKNVNN